MKKMFQRFSVIIFLSLLINNSANAQYSTESRTQTFITLSAGVSIPLLEDDFKDRFNPGYNVSGKFGIDLNRYYKVRIGFQHSEFGSKIDSVKKLLVTNIGAELVLNDIFSSQLSFYPVIGASFYLLNQHDVSETILGVSAGAGVNYSLNQNKKVFLSLEAGINYFFNTDETVKLFIPDSKALIPITLGITFML